MHVQLGDLPGRMVLDAAGVVLGRIKVPLVDMETWLVDALRVRPSRRVAGELGLKWLWWKRPTIDIPTGLIHAAGEAILLRVSLGELHDATPEVAGEAASVSIH
jgi:sporulation protein YlmC with PRC-barrel domain